MPKTKNKLGQYFTPQHVTDFMIDVLMTQDKKNTVLEPSSGEGIFLKCLENKGYQNIVGVEVDPELAKMHEKVTNESFVTWEPQNDQKIHTVIGNPPYIRWKDLDDKNKKDLQESKYWGEKLSYLTDFLNLFIIKSVDLLEENGELIFITPKFWMNTLSSQAMRNWLLDQGHFDTIIDFGESTVFPGVGSHIVIFKFIKNSTKDNKNLDIRFYEAENRTVVKENLSLESFSMTLIPAFEKDKPWTYVNSQKLDILTEFENKCVKNNEKILLGQYMNCANGLVSGLDKVFNVSDEDYSKLNELEKTFVIQVAKAKDMKRFKTEQVSKYFFIPANTFEEDTVFEQSLPFFAKKLEPLKEQLLKRHSYTENLKYWEWSFPRSQNFHFNGQQKIMVPVKERLTSKEFVRFSLVEPEVVATQDVFSLAPKEKTQESIHFIAAFLTLPVVTTWIKTKGLMKGGIAEFGSATINKMPFRAINWESEQEKTIHDNVTNMVIDGKELVEVHAELVKLFSDFEPSFKSF